MELVINPPQEVFNQLIHWAAVTNGWAHQPYDYKFYTENYDGFWFVTVVDKSKDPSKNLVAGGSLARWDVKNGATLYSIGLFYCKEEYRGMGYGKQVFQKIMDIVGEDNCVLSAAVNMSQKYANGFGFTEMLPYWHLKAEIQPGKVKIPELSDEFSTKNWKDVDSNLLEAYDLSICPRNRKMRMRNWFQQDGVYARIAFDSAHKIVGYCAIRTVNLNRLAANPLYAENKEVAARLLGDVINEIPDFQKFDNLIMKCPVVNENLDSLLSKFLPKDGYSIKKVSRIQFTKKIIPSRDDVVYSMACSTHQFN